MTMTANTIIYPVRDLAAAKSVYTTLLGTEPYVDEPYYVGYRVEGQELGLDPHGFDQGFTGPVPFYDVDDLAGMIGALTAAGAEQVAEPRDVGGGMQIARVKDADGNVFGLRTAPAA